jgi:hypothetical protein
MKKMKLFCGILIGCMMLSSCFGNDAFNFDTDPIYSIVGSWKEIRFVKVCSTGSEDITDAGSCIQTGSTTFSENGSFSITEYNLTNGNCELDITTIGSWVIEDGNLTVTIDGNTIEVTLFELSGNTLHLGQYDSGLYNSCDDGSLVSYHYTELLRVE